MLLSPALAAFLASAALAAGTGPSTRPEATPVACLFDLNPWLDVRGSDVPRFVLYDDGTVIFVAPRDAGHVRLQTKLPPERAKAFVEPFFDRFAELPSRRAESGATDQHSVQILLRRGDRWLGARVYGPQWLGAVDAGAPRDVFEELYRAMVTFDDPSAEPARPPRIEVMLWGFEHARESRPWPRSVPAPPATATPPREGVLSHFLPGSQEPAVRAFLSQLDATTAVELNGHRWAMRYRPVLAGDALLRKVSGCVGRGPRADSVNACLAAR